jgi:hypothetical protein
VIEQSEAAGAIEQLRRLAEILGYTRVWSEPGDDAVWFCERDGAPGRIEAARLDDLVQDLVSKPKPEG